ncbi:hypothetical protein A2765_04170 [Candidatus Kaiserbacteria bacterium RIFCSPHIGHO2_01_FULL_56_24]|uniref:Nudix hydrolase domain-containing protein n=1 Tax=Candidatus Kaiserbacteria bacterium RIFCSPHIGHO2_01_FULL_56_24 TaxID=1798487 RepID=A0A1F6DEF9_9BACT|nr:MAG: hypothetical protein A2765_04170 [Candidatus Kaiserbacteria bacterium RIFCSPHIGHO2_01_FULL_56_24]
MIFKEPPVDFNKQFDIVGCYVMHEDRFLMLHRHAWKPNGNTWGLPAGKRDGEESLLHAMQRELREETGIRVLESELRYFDHVSVRHDEHDFRYHMFSLSFDEALEIQLSESEHQAFRWVTPNETLSMPLVHDQDECIRMFFGRVLVE